MRSKVAQHRAQRKAQQRKQAKKQRHARPSPCRNRPLIPTVGRSSTSGEAP